MINFLQFNACNYSFLNTYLRSWGRFFHKTCWVLASHIDLCQFPLDHTHLSAICCCRIIPMGLVWVIWSCKKSDLTIYFNPYFYECFSMNLCCLIKLFILISGAYKVHVWCLPYIFFWWATGYPLEAVFVLSLFCLNSHQSLSVVSMLFSLLEFMYKSIWPGVLVDGAYSHTEIQK